MSRDINPDLALALEQTHINAIVAAEFEFDSGTIGMWSGVGNLIWGDKEFIGGGNLVGMSTVRETQDLQANSLTFSLNGIAPENIFVALEEKFQGRPCRVWIGNSDTGIKLALEDEPGAVQLETGEYILLESTLLDTPYLIFEGMMNVMNGKVQIPVSRLSLSAENILAILKRANVSFYTDEDQQAKYPGDLFLEFIAALQDKNIVW